MPTDVDVLLVYPAGQLESAHRLATKLRRLDIWPPVEVVALSEDEERELDFVTTVGAKKIWEAGPQAVKQP